MKVLVVGVTHVRGLAEKPHSRSEYGAVCLDEAQQSGEPSQKLVRAADMHPWSPSAQAKEAKFSLSLSGRKVGERHRSWTQLGRGRVP